MAFLCIITNSSNPVSLSGIYNLLRGDPLAGSLLWFWISAEFALKILLSDFQSWGGNKPSKGAHPHLSYYHEENTHETTLLCFVGFEDIKMPTNNPLLQSTRRSSLFLTTSLHGQISSVYHRLHAYPRFVLMSIVAEN